MVLVYVNYPGPSYSVHYDLTCTSILRRKKIDQRIIRIEDNNLKSQLDFLEEGKLVFGSNSKTNDAWISIDLADSAYEKEIIKSIFEILCRHYPRFRKAEIVSHCQKDKIESNKVRSNKTLTIIPLSPNQFSRVSHIRDRENKINQILGLIKSGINEINSKYRTGPSLYFYKRVLACRKELNNITDFINNQYCVEILYATLVSWDMDSRGAKLKYFSEFHNCLSSIAPEFGSLQNETAHNGISNPEIILKLLKDIYNKMNLMETSGRLVSNSKCLHFLFPDVCMPMDGTNTLQYLFGNTYESIDRFIDIVNFSLEIMKNSIPFEKYLDHCWNQSIPKLIDNAIILLNGKSLRS